MNKIIKSYIYKNIVIDNQRKSLLSILIKNKISKFDEIKLISTIELEKTVNEYLYKLFYIIKLQRIFKKKLNNKITNVINLYNENLILRKQLFEQTQLINNLKYKNNNLKKHNKKRCNKSVLINQLTIVRFTC
mgnify:CR=1 FL=1